jgi:hypothetical protein
MLCYAVCASSLCPGGLGVVARHPSRPAHSSLVSLKPLCLGPRKQVATNIQDEQQKLTLAVHPLLVVKRATHTGTSPRSQLER